MAEKESVLFGSQHYKVGKRMKKYLVLIICWVLLIFSSMLITGKLPIGIIVGIPIICALLWFIERDKSKRRKIEK